MATAPRPKELQQDLTEFAMELNPIRTQKKLWAIALGSFCSIQRRKLKRSPTEFARKVGLSSVRELVKFEVGEVCFPEKLEAIAKELRLKDARQYLELANNMMAKPLPAAIKRPKVRTH